MFDSVRRNMNDIRNHSNSNVSLLAAIGMPILIGGAGLAVDFSQWYTWKRELQLATDQAAISAAWALTDTLTTATYQVRGTQDYNANLAVTKSFASAPRFTLANYANGTNNAVIASASATKALPFSSVFIGHPVTIAVSSMASFAPGKAYSACLTATGKNGTTFEIGGNADVQAHCGLAALSCSEDALTIDGSATVVADAIATCGTAQVGSNLQSVVSDHVTGLTDQYAGLATPTNPTLGTTSCSGNGSKKVCTYNAGTYTGGIQINSTATMNPGIYGIDGGTLDLSANDSVVAAGVLFVLKNGATIKFGGEGNNNSMTLSPITSAILQSTYGYSKSLADQYDNMLVFEDRNNNPTQSHILNGNSNSLLKGTIYLPSGNLQVNGTANLDSDCLQISANTINILGNASLDTRCTSAQTNSLGSSTPTVKLVA
jgi:Flp pilus assembly protein TadG